MIRTRHALARTLVLACLLLTSALGSALAWSQPRIGVATMQPGEIFFERFGHNAIVVDDPGQPEALSYNFGFFDPEAPDFISGFIRGHMQYNLVALPLSQDLAYYREMGRGVSIQWLDLSDAEAQSLAAALAENARPENARYRYDYFTDNCSTRVRDALDTALSGLLRSQLEGRSRGNTYRGDAVRLASPAAWMWLGFDLGLGPSADQPHSLWQDAFVPMRLADALAHLQRADGRPLVAETVEVLPHRLPAEPQDTPRAWWPWLLAGLVLAGGLWALGQRHRHRVAQLALPFWCASGLLGLLIGFIWLGTEHRFGWANQNLLLLSPLCLLLLPGGWRIARGRDGGRWFRVVLAAIALGTVAAWFLHWLPVLPQRNVHWIALLSPLHAMLWWLLRKPRP